MPDKAYHTTAHKDDLVSLLASLYDRLTDEGDFSVDARRYWSKQIAETLAWNPERFKQR